MRRTALILLVAVAVAAFASPASMAKPGKSKKAAKNKNSATYLANRVTVAGVWEHVEAFQAIADEHGGIRAAGTPGYDASAVYVASQLSGKRYKKWTVRMQEFEFPFYIQTAPPTFRRTTPTSETYVEDTDFATMDYSGSGDVTGSIQAVDVVVPPGAAANTSTSGCEASDFAGFTADVALLQRGTCAFGLKAQNAEAAGADAVIIFNEGQPGRTDVLVGTLGEPIDIPVIFTSFAVGEELYTLDQSGDVTVNIVTHTLSEIRTTTNVIADYHFGKAANTIVVGAHLDSVTEGPGINDNATGSAAILEVAQELAENNIHPKNHLRFIWFGAEEGGLIGSEYYVSQLSEREIGQIDAMLNFDMVGSPNSVRFVYDGDGSDTGIAGPEGSAFIEDLFVNWFSSRGLASEPTEFSGRSDYGPFIAVGIPAGGLFTGAEGIKTAEQAAVFGGTAGIAYDPCYHQACDTIANVDRTVLDQMTDAVAGVVYALGFKKGGL